MSNYLEASAMEDSFSKITGLRGRHLAGIDHHCGCFSSGLM